MYILLNSIFSFCSSSSSLLSLLSEDSGGFLELGSSFPWQFGVTSILQIKTTKY